MMRIVKNIAAGVITVALALMAPVTVDFREARADITKIVSVNDACGQATSCKPQNNYICSTIHRDYSNYTCNTGCQVEPD